MIFRQREAVLFNQFFVRVRLIFNLKNKGGHVPFHHQYLLAQVIKGIVVRGGSEEYRNYSFYNFSGLKGQTKISRNGLHFYSSKVTLVISSPDQSFIDYFLKNLFEYPQIEIGALVLLPDAVEKEHLPEFKDQMKFLCISPIVGKKPVFNDPESKKFIPPEDEEFSDLLYESTMARMESSGLFTAAQIDSFNKFELIPDAQYLKKIRDNNKKFARIYPVFDQDVKYEVRGYTFPFELFAAKEVQKFLFTSGTGEFTYKGFGMLDIAHADPIDRTEPYLFS